MTSKATVRYLICVLVISLLTSCGYPETPEIPALSPTSQPTTENLPQDINSTGSSDLDKAQTTLITFFSHLSQGRYSQAEELYGGPEDQYEMLRNNNPTVDPEDKVALLTAGCTYQHLCLAIQGVVEAEQVSPTDFHFVVQFANPDGSLFVLGPCCGADETEMPPRSKFDYQVNKVEDQFLVIGELLYVP